MGVEGGGGGGRGAQVTRTQRLHPPLTALNEVNSHFLNIWEQNFPGSLIISQV